MSVNVWAPRSYWSLHPDEKNRICNACGPANSKFDFVPDTIWGLYIGEVCNIHDYMYNEGRTLEDKKAADRIFLNNMLRLIEGKTKRYLIKYSIIKIKNPLLWLRRRRAEKYYWAVDKFGGPAYWREKNRLKTQWNEIRESR